MNDIKSFFQRNLVLLVAFGAIIISISFLLLSSSSPTPKLSLSDASAASQLVYRFWSEPYQSHFYTVSEAERDFVILNDNNWIYEGIAFDAFAGKQPNASPVYRFWNETQRSHFYTQSEVERDNVRLDRQWRLEGVAYYVLDKTEGSQPVYRLYSPSRQAHYYAPFESERDALLASGEWNYEGVAFYSKRTTADSVAPDSPVPPVVPPTLINGSCGSNHEGVFDVAPSTQLCISGSATSISGSGPWEWNCQGLNGGSPAQCSAQKTAVVATQCSDGIDNDGDGVTDLVDTDCSDASDDNESGTSPSSGQCGEADGTTDSSVPASASLCTDGTVQNQITSGDQFMWDCQGDNGGASDSCQLTLTSVVPINGQCSTVNGAALTTVPNEASLCTQGIVSLGTATGSTYPWSCQGQNGGTDENCSATLNIPMPINGQCGTSDEGTFDNAPTVNLCAAGNPTSVAGLGPWSWDCDGVDGGTDSSCTAQKTVVASQDCGVDHGQDLSAPPQNLLCANGLTSADETGSGPWLWTCRDSSNTLIASCRAELQGATADTQGECGSALNACDVGDFIDTDDSDTQHLWGCIGSGGFSTFASCSLDITTDTGNVSGPISTTLNIPVSTLTPGLNWADSYSANGQCYCATTYDHNVANILVSTPDGQKTVRDICEKIGPGPGKGSNPVYNDVQCGHGPANDAGDEDICPGRVDQGRDGCRIAGPTWNLSAHYPGS